MTTGYRFQGGYVASLPNAASFQQGTAGNMMDRFNHLWFCPMALPEGNRPTYVIDDTGAVLATHVQSDVMTEIATYALAHQAGSVWTITAPEVLGSSGFNLSTYTFAGVSYVVFHMILQNGTIASGPYQWFFVTAVYIANVDGSMSIQGVSWTIASFGPPDFFGGTCKIDLAKTKTIDDQILVMVDWLDTLAQPMLIVFPPISAIIGAASAVNTTRLLMPGASHNPGDTFYGFACPQMNSAVGNNGPGCDQAVFFMPNAAGGTNLYVYVGKRTMATSGIPYIVTLRATYPDGVMVKAVLPAVVVTPTVTFPTLTNVNLAPAADPGVFLTAAAAPYDAFSDVGLNFDGTAGNASNDYYGVPRVFGADGSKLLVGWYAPWFTNNTYTGTGWSVDEKLRIQSYDPATELFTDLALVQGQTVNINQIGSSGGAPPEFIDISGWALYQDGDTLKLWHVNGPAATGAARWITWLSGIAKITAILPQRHAAVEIHYHRVRV